MKYQLLNPMVCALAFAAALPAGAQEATARPAIAPMVVQPVQTFQPGPDGRLNYSYSDVTKLITGQTQEWFKQREDDRKFLEKSVQDIVDAYNKIYTNIYTNKLMKMSQESMVNASNPIPVNDFLALDREYKAAREVYVARMDGIKAIPEGGLPSANMIVTENKSQEIPPWRSLDVTKIIAEFNDKLNNLDQQINALQFRVADIMNVQQVVNGFNIDYSQLTLIKPEDRDAARARLNNLRNLSLALQKQQDLFTGFLVKSAKLYVSQFGEKEQYRWRNEADMQAAKDAYSRIAEMFWVRSYERMKYGMPQGGIDMKYKKQWLKIEELMMNPSQFVDFGTIQSDGEYLSVRTQNDLENVQENIRQNARVADHRATLGGSVSPIAIAANLWTTLTGRKAQLETASMVLKLITADIHEEILVVSAGGRDKMVDYYTNRYYSTPEAKQAARKLECEYDSQFTELRIHHGAKDPADQAFKCGTSSVGSQAMLTGTRSFFQKIDQSSRDQIQNFTIANKLAAQLDAQTGNSKVDNSLLDGLPN